ncbi:hypothetical protein CBS11852_3351 [Aspergillus niger]|nr:hypothetical protein CBS11852_3351 [Aspergillus niger]
MGTLPTWLSALLLLLWTAAAQSPAIDVAGTIADPTPLGPTMSGTPSDCNRWFTIKKGDTCYELEKAFGLTPQQFQQWNPAVSHDCLVNFWPGYAYCVGTGPVAIPTSADTAPHAPTMTGIAANCNRWYTAQKGDNCYAVEKAFGLAPQQFQQWNPAVSLDCLVNFWAGYAYCVGVGPAANGPHGPTMPGIAPNCIQFYTAKKGDTCYAVEKAFGISPQQFQQWNPAVSLDCLVNFWPDYADFSFDFNNFNYFNYVHHFDNCPSHIYHLYCLDYWHVDHFDYFGTYDCFYHFHHHSHFDHNLDFECPSTIIGTFTTSTTALPPSTTSSSTTSTSSASTTVTSSTSDTSTTLTSPSAPTTPRTVTSTTPRSPSITPTPSTMVTTNPNYSTRNPITSYNQTITPIDTAWPPTKTHPGQPKNCDKWHLVAPGDTCRSIYQRHGNSITMDELLEWNPDLKADCDYPIAGYWVCVGIKRPALTIIYPTTNGTAPDPTPWTPRPLPTETAVYPPTKTQPGLAPSCSAYYEAQPSDTCDQILASNPMLKFPLLFEWNPALKADCSGILPGYFYCIAAYNSTNLPSPPTVTNQPYPMKAGTAKNCTAWYKKEDVCGVESCCRC